MSLRQAKPPRKKLLFLLISFFLALMLPIAFLAGHAVQQLKWESFYQYRLVAEEFVTRVNQKLEVLVVNEEKRAFSEYSFLNVTGDYHQALQRSPLAAFPPDDGLAGLIGYFQIDGAGKITSPVLPEPLALASEYGLTNAEIAQRKELLLGLSNKLWQWSNENVADPLLESPFDVTDSGVQYTSKNEDDATDDSLNVAAEVVASALQASGLTEAVPEIREEESRGLFSSDAPMSLSPPPVAAIPQKSEASKPDPEKTAQESKSRYLGQLDDLNIETNFQKTDEFLKKTKLSKVAVPNSVKRTGRKEQGALPLLQEEIQDASVVERAKGQLEQDKDSAEERMEQKEKIPNTVAKNNLEITSISLDIFESEISPLEVKVLESGYLMFYRVVRQGNDKFIQGFLVDYQRFLQSIVGDLFAASSLVEFCDVVLAYHSNVLAVFDGNARSGSYLRSNQVSGELLYRTQLTIPFNNLEMVISMRALPELKGTQVILLSVGLFILLMATGMAIIYWLALKEWRLSQQQQNFVSAVSHELKTPLTSIRMYSEILEEGWASEEQKKQYYLYIKDESERLSRLIENVLQLARLRRNDLKVDLHSVSVNRILDHLGSKLDSQVQRAGFTLCRQCPEPLLDRTVLLDLDAFTQIIINLVDNAMKFSVKSEKKQIDFAVHGNHKLLVFSVRDYGNGIAKSDHKQVYDLFYRAESELTRETSGTGIGLALVKQLADAMKAKVEFENLQPGVIFKIEFQGFE
jgi:signal transduction histidine kinase